MRKPHKWTQLNRLAVQIHDKILQTTITNLPQGKFAITFLYKKPLDKIQNHILTLRCDNYMELQFILQLTLARGEGYEKVGKKDSDDMYESACYSRDAVTDKSDNSLN